MRIESLPPEKRITGRSNSPATSRKMCTASDSSASRWLSAYGVSASPVFPVPPEFPAPVLTAAAVVMPVPSR